MLNLGYFYHVLNKFPAPIDYLAATVKTMNQSQVHSCDKIYKQLRKVNFSFPSEFNLQFMSLPGQDKFFP